VTLGDGERSRIAARVEPVTPGAAGRGLGDTEERAGFGHIQAYHPAGDPQKIFRY
jgi:hypothetical protein